MQHILPSTIILYYLGITLKPPLLCNFSLCTNTTCISNAYLYDMINSNKKTHFISKFISSELNPQIFLSVRTLFLITVVLWYGLIYLSMFIINYFSYLAPSTYHTHNTMNEHWMDYRAFSSRIKQFSNVTLHPRRVNHKDWARFHYYIYIIQVMYKKLVFPQYISKWSFISLCPQEVTWCSAACDHF